MLGTILKQDIKRGYIFFFYFTLGHQPSWNEKNLFQTSVGFFRENIGNFSWGAQGFFFRRVWMHQIKTLQVGSKLNSHKQYLFGRLQSIKTKKTHTGLVNCLPWNSQTCNPRACELPVCELQAEQSKSCELV